MGKMVVVNTGMQPNGSTVNVSLVEVSDDPDTPVINPSTLNLVIPEDQAANYVTGTKWDMTLNKSNTTTPTQSAG